MASARYVLAAPLALLLGSCVFIDDFEQFRDNSESDGGSDEDGGTEGDADVEPMSDGGRSDGSTPRDASADAGRDARTDGQTPSDAGTTPRDSGNPGTDDAGTQPPPDTGTPAPGCSSAAITPTLACYPDQDGDRFADLKAQPLPACSCPEGTLSVPSPSTTQSDCWDDPNTHGADVFPGQTLFFQNGYGIGGTQFDYNCDSAESKSRQVIPADCTGLLGLLCNSDTKGYTREIACGKAGEYQVCGTVGLNCGVADSKQIIQTCR